MPEPLVLINLFSMPAEMVDAFVTAWPSSIASTRQAAGFRGTRLHRALNPRAQYPLVNVARWDTVEAWEATVRAHFAPSDNGANASLQGPWQGDGSVSAHPNLYRVVHVTPDPQDAPETPTSDASDESGAR